MWNKKANPKGGFNPDSFNQSGLKPRKYEMDCYGVVSIKIIPLIEWICGNGFAGSYFRAIILSVGAMHSQEMICPFAAILPPNASPLLRLTPMAAGGRHVIPMGVRDKIFYFCNIFLDFFSKYYYNSLKRFDKMSEYPDYIYKYSYRHCISSYLPI